MSACSDQDRIAACETVKLTRFSSSPWSPLGHARFGLEADVAYRAGGLILTLVSLISLIRAAAPLPPTTIEDLSDLQNLALFYVDRGAARLASQSMHPRRDKQCGTFYDVPIRLYGRPSVH